MLRRKVTSPDGRVWTLGRRWVPRRRRLGRVDLGKTGFEVPDPSGLLDDLGIVGGIIGTVLLAIALVFLVLVLFNVLAIAVELLLVVILLLAGIVGRVVFRRPWTVFAKSDRNLYERPVVGWRASRRAIRVWADQLGSGAQLEP